MNDFEIISEEFSKILFTFIGNSYSTINKVYQNTPGSRVVWKYVRESYQHDPARTFLEIGLLILLLWYFLHNRSRVPGASDIKLTEKEVEELCHEWEPEPLVPELTDFQKQELQKQPIQTGQSGFKIKFVNDGKEKMNFASLDFLSLMNRESIKEKAILALRKYGVGSCGPRGFYGTIDVHLELEAKLAEFIGVEAAIIYSQNFSTITSAIPAFSKRGDTIIAYLIGDYLIFSSDEGSSLGLQVGQNISRSNIHYFKHNDMKDLERVLEEVRQNDIKKKKPLSRKFIVVEAIYFNTGDVAPLPELVRLKKIYKYRLIVEESLSFGVLGVRGAGLAEHYNLPPSEVDIMVGSMTNSLGSSGGFVCGSLEICEHQRLSGQAYTYSASLPAMLAVSSLEAIALLEKEPELLSRLRENTHLFWSILTKAGSNRFSFSGGNLDSSVSVPVIFIELKDRLASREEEDMILQEIVDIAFKDGVLITRSKPIQSFEKFLPKPSIRIFIAAGFTKKDVEKAAVVVRDAVKVVAKTKRGI